MIIHHFYPRTSNLGDHLVKDGIQRLFSDLRPDASFRWFDINARGHSRVDYGLTASRIEEANNEADLVVIGGSNLYEGRDSWGVACAWEALPALRVPLFLVGIGTGSPFGKTSPTIPVKEIAQEIRQLNDVAQFSGVRDVVTLEWLSNLGVPDVQLMGDPATFIELRPYERSSTDRILAVPPNSAPVRRSQRHINRKIFRVRIKQIFRRFRAAVFLLREAGYEVVVAINDKDDRDFMDSLLGDSGVPLVLPASPEGYRELILSCGAVLTGRLHTAILSLSLGRPFVLLNVDQRTQGFLRTYDTRDFTLDPYRERSGAWVKRCLHLMEEREQDGWSRLLGQRDAMWLHARKLIGEKMEHL